MRIGNHTLANPVILAPMAGITDKTYRSIAKEQGVDLVYTEMISAKALSYKNLKTRELLDIRGETPPVAVQIFGSEPEIMAEAALKAQALGAAMVDVNMGCPVPKVVKNREGSALLEEPELAAAIVSAMAKAVAVPVSVKIRLGMTAKRIVAVDFASRMARAGAAAVAVHGRTRDQYYGGQADWGMIRQVKEALRPFGVPVIGSGDIWQPQDAARMLAETGCDAVMIGRGALGNPWLLGRTVRYLAGTPLAELPEPKAAARVAAALEHSRRLVAVKGEAKGMPEMRKHLAWYLKGLPRTAPLKEKLFHTRTLAEAESLLREYLETLETGEPGKKRE
ncbi:MAG: tRNA dihydrouridine synthase DusB [Peptococcaceae bacterium]|nr:tRNA dihydrouridine synthase DusB [Peptococcaceae bacterium]